MDKRGAAYVVEFNKPAQDAHSVIYIENQRNYHRNTEASKIAAYSSFCKSMKFCRN